MKTKFLLIIGLVAVVVLLAGCTQNQLSSPVPEGKKNCGTDISCFANAALDNCKQASVTSTFSVNLFGVTQTTTMDIESKGIEGTKCILYQKYIKNEIEFPPELLQNMTEEQITEAKQLAKIFEGKDMTCKLEKQEFYDYIGNIKSFVETGSGSFSSDDLPKEKCTGSIYEISDQCQTNTECNDNDNSTKDECKESSKLCVHTPIISCTNSDNYCPSNCNSENDSDCKNNSCGELSGRICAIDEQCSTNYVSASDSTKCCLSVCEKINSCGNVNCSDDQKCVSGNCVLKTCAEKNGIVCSSNQTCNGIGTNSFDAQSCCIGTCESSNTAPSNAYFEGNELTNLTGKGTYTGQTLKIKIMSISATGTTYSARLELYSGTTLIDSETVSAGTRLDQTFLSNGNYILADQVTITTIAVETSTNKGYILFNVVT
jgi:hypothetical protein